MSVVAIKKKTQIVGYSLAVERATLLASTEVVISILSSLSITTTITIIRTTVATDDSTLLSSCIHLLGVSLLPQAAVAYLKICV